MVEGSSLIQKLDNEVKYKKQEMQNQASYSFFFYAVKSVISPWLNS